MNLKVAVTVLFIAALGFGIVGCSYKCYENPYSFKCSTTMDNVLHAAVRHKCLPPVQTSTQVMCTSVQDPKNIVVTITLSNNYVIIANDWKSQVVKDKDAEDFKNNVEQYDKKIKVDYAYLTNVLENCTSLTKEQKKEQKEELNRLENELDEKLATIERLQKKHKFPTMEEYNAWVRAFGEKIQAETNRRIRQEWP